MTDKQREDNVRRRLAKAGYGVHKDRATSITGHHLGGYMVYDQKTSAVVCGADYSATLTELEELADDLKREDDTDNE